MRPASQADRPVGSGSMPSAGRRAGRASGSQESHGPSARRRRPAAPMHSTGRRASPCARRAAPAPPKAGTCAHRRRRAPSRRSRARGCARAPSWWAAPTRAGGLVRDAIPGLRESSFGYRFLSAPCDPSRRTPGSKIRCLLSAYRRFAVTRRSTDPRRRGPARAPERGHGRPTSVPGSGSMCTGRVHRAHYPSISTIRLQVSTHISGNLGYGHARWGGHHAAGTFRRCGSGGLSGCRGHG